MLVIAAVTAASLLIVRHRLGKQIVANLSDDLVHSVESFQNMESERLAELDRRNALLANLPSLKALMTTRDKVTIADASVQFWKVSGNDLFAVSNAAGRVMTAYTKAFPHDPALEANLETAIRFPDRHYLLSGSTLYQYSVRPLFFGSEESGTLLGYVISGDAIDTPFVTGISHASDVHAAFLDGDHVVVSTTPHLPVGASFHSDGERAAPLTLSGERFLSTSRTVSVGRQGPLQLVVFKPFARAEREAGEIDRLVLIVGVSAIAVGITLMLVISGLLTGPLEVLAASVRAFGAGRVEQVLPENGPREVRELSVAFASMREEIQMTNHALLEAERLATIGRIASSVSHDLRHYLATIYANAEFLASGNLSAPERREIFEDLGSAVHGTTDLLDSLLIFSRSGPSVRRQHELLATLLEQTIALARKHPDAQGATFTATYEDPVDTEALVDARQIERAIYNLLLNACQARTAPEAPLHVHVDLKTCSDSLTLLVTDDGAGVPNEVRERIFEPFVSQGKQKGTGLGLTLVSSIAMDHGGHANLISSRAGETVFSVTIKRSSGKLSAQETAAKERQA